MQIAVSFLQDAAQHVAPADRLRPNDWRALTPLIYGHIHPYGRFDLDLTKRLAIELLQAA